MEHEKTLVMGNVAMAEAAVRAGCRFYAGYPITPQNEVSEYLAKRLPEAGGVFLQAESELAAINMVFGAASTGARAMTSSSSPGISLMQEAISYLAAAQIPCLIANIRIYVTQVIICISIIWIYLYSFFIHRYCFFYFPFIKIRHTKIKI